MDMKRYESLVKQFNVKVALVRTIILYALERRLTSVDYC